MLIQHTQRAVRCGKLSDGPEWQTLNEEKSSESPAKTSAPGAIQNIVSGARNAQMGGGSDLSFAKGGDAP